LELFFGFTHRSKGRNKRKSFYDVNYISIMLLLKAGNIAKQKEGDALWRTLYKYR